MSSAYLLQHDELYPPGRLVPIVRDFGIPTTLVRLDKGQPLPSDPDEIRLLVLLGGRLRTSEIGTAAQPFLTDEVALVKQMVDADRPVLGIGFGAGTTHHRRRRKGDGEPQAVAASAAGIATRAARRPRARVRVAEHQLSVPRRHRAGDVRHGRQRALLLLARRHLHPADAPAPPNPPPPPAPRPPTGNVVMAGSRTCRMQAYKFKNRVFAFQFHFELEAAQIDKIIDARASEGSLTAEQVATMKGETAKHASRYDRLGSKLITNYVQFLKTYAERDSALAAR